MTTRFAMAAVLVAVSLARSPAADPPAAFTRTTIDLGLVVADAEKSAKFYTEAIGFKEVPGFAVPAELAGDAGLTDHHALKVRVFVLGDGATATRLKLVEVDGPKSKKNDNEFIESQLGLRYLTISVIDTTAALERLKKAGVAPLAKSPVAIGGAGFLTCVRDPDGNLVELVGPKK